MTAAKPALRPNVPHFSSGPCAKRPGWNPQNLKDAALGRSHRAKVGKAKLKLAIELTREVLEVPADYRIGIVPASDTGAVEMALWSLLGARPVTTIAWESFGEGWVSDIVKELKLKDVTKLHAGYGEIPDLSKVDPASDVVFTWNGTTSGVRVPNADWIKSDREGLTICDATSAAFAQKLDWSKLDVVTFSWQKALGGEAAHGMLVLSPRAVARLDSYKPACPLPKVFLMTTRGHSGSERCRAADAVDRLGFRRDQSFACKGRVRFFQMSRPKVLISDALSPAAVQIFKDRGIEVDFQPNLGKDKEKLAEIIGNYDGLAIRSATKATAKILDKAKRLKVIGRAGIGVDNVEIPAATAKGIIVMNTPFGNSITTAEHAITLMLALAREIPQADASTQAGKWEKNRFMGVEITGKTLGVIGCGNIGSIAADRALGLKMKVIAFDPFLSPERAKDIGVEKVELDELLRRADFITLHTPLTDKTRNIIDASALAKTKKGVRIINCARGGLVDERALVDALNSGQVAGAAFDVFVEEPATSNVLFGHPNVICTPHLGAATTEAQENVALQVAEQMSDYLLSGAISNAVNFPSITAEEAPKLKPFIGLAEKRGSFAGQLTETGIMKVQITYEGHVAEMKIKALTSAVLSGLLRPMLGDVNVVSAPVVAKERGMIVDEIVRAAQSDYESLITVTVRTERQERSVSGTVYADGKPRLVDIKGIRVDAEFGKSMIYVTNEDKPGFIGHFAGLLGDAKINIATFHLGRNKPGGDAIALVEVDGAVPADVLAKVQALPQVKQAKALTF